MLNSFLSQVIDSFPVVVDNQTSLQSAIAAMQRADFTAIWVTAASPSTSLQLLGAVFPEQLLKALSTFSQSTETTLDSIMRSDLPLLTQDHLAAGESTVEWLLAQFEAYQVDCLPLVNDDSFFLGTIHRWKLLQVCCHRESPEKLAHLLQTSQIGFFIMMLDEPLQWNSTIDRDSALDYVFSHQKILCINEAMSMQYGLSRDEMMGKTPADLFAHDLVYGRQVWQRFFDLGIISETTHERRLDDNTTIWIEGFYRCLYDDQGRIVGHLGIQRDMTNLKSMQSRLVQQEAYLRFMIEVQEKLVAAGHQFISDFLSHPENLHEPFDESQTQFSLKSALSDLRSLYQDLLCQLGNTAQAARVDLAEHQGEGNMSLQLVWQTQDRSKADNPSEPSCLDTPYPAEWLARLSAGQVIHAHAAELPESDRACRPPDIFSVLVLPLMIEHQLWGVIRLENCRAASLWGETEIKLLTAAVAVMMMHLETCHIAYQLHNSWYRERCTRQLIKRIRQTLQLDDIVDSTTQELRQLLGCDRTVIYRFNSDWSGNFIAESVAPGWLPLAQLYPESPQLPGNTVGDDDCSVQNWQPGMLLEADTYLQESRGGEYRQGKPYSCVVDIGQTDFDPCYPPLIQQMQAVAYLTVPIFVGDRLWGLLANYQNRGPRQWGSSDISLVIQIATQLGVALEHVELLEQTRRQALELAQAKIKAEAASQARTEFLANVSHELRTPLNAILGFSQILAEELTTLPQRSPEAPAAEFQEYVDIISRNGHNLLGLVNNVLEVARLESGPHQVRLSRFDLHQLLQDLETASAPTAAQKGIRFNVRLDPHLPKTITSDREKLFKVLLNLLNNAIKFTQTGSVTLRAAVLAKVNLDDQKSRLNLAFEVEDTGQGINSEELQRLFQPFPNTHADWQTNLESGLSFAASRQFINMLGGDISVSSTFNHGSLFKLNIWAIVDPLPTADQTPDPSAIKQTIEPPPLTYRILVVTTQSQNHPILQQFLWDIGCELRTASSGDEALGYWPDWQPHLMLIEPDLAIVEGRSIVQHIQQSTANPNLSTLPESPVTTKVIALTNMASSPIEERIIPDFDDTLDWPAQTAALLQILIKHLALKDAQVVQFNLTHQLAKQDLAITSLQWRQQLRQAAIAGSDDKLLDLAAQLPPEHTLLAKALIAFATNFQFGQILDLLESHKNP